MCQMTKLAADLYRKLEQLFMAHRYNNYDSINITDEDELLLNQMDSLWNSMSEQEQFEASNTAMPFMSKLVKRPK